MLEDDLAREYKYKKLPDEVSDKARAEYLRSIPSFLKIDGDAVNLYTKSNTLIVTGYDRIVIGDYGAFLEINCSQMVYEHLQVKKGQEYRIFDEKYNKSVKYFWYTPTDDSDMKIYFQQRTVVYADYKPNKFYIRPLDVII